MIKPNFFIIGGMKCGTTSLHNYLALHPKIFMSDNKEPHFFVEKNGVASDMSMEEYLSLFKDAGDAKVVGESTTGYTKLPIYTGAAEKIHDFSPDAKLLYVMRNPIKRTISHYWYNSLSLQGYAESRPILKAIQEDPRYISFSDYKMQLIPYMKLFGRDKIYIVTYEKLFGDIFSEVNKICKWLGVDEFTDEKIFERKWNETPTEIKQATGFGLLNAIRNTRIWDKLAPIVPQMLRKKLSQMSVKTVNKNEEDIDQVVEYLTPIFQGKKRELEQYIGVELSEWDF